MKHSAEFADRVAIVTGASSGIGRAIAVLLAARGARVLAVGRDEGQLRAVANETGAIPCVAELEAPEVRPTVVAAARKLGPIQILINAAGRAGSQDRLIWEQSSADWRKTMAVNLEAPFELSRAAAQDMRAGGRGRIIMISSTAGEVGAPSLSPYCTSKHGLIGLMRSVAQDLASFGATCNAVLPGWVRTTMAERDAEREATSRHMSVDAVWAERISASPAKRLVTAQEVAEVVAFLCADAASAINGEAITVSLGSHW